MSRKIGVLKSAWKHDLISVTKRDLAPYKDLRKPWFIITPESIYMEYWSKFMTLLLVYTAIVTP